MSFAVLRISRVRGDRVVAGRDLEVEPRGEDVLAEDRPRPARHGEDECDAGDRAVLHALRAGGAHTARQRASR